MRLYKYLHPDRIDVLRHGVIRFTSPRVLNDPFELKPHISAMSPENMVAPTAGNDAISLIFSEWSKLSEQSRNNIPFGQFLILASSRIENDKGLSRFLIDKGLSIVTQQLLPDGMEEMIGLLCLSESPDNLLMGVHYADSHQGFVIEFDSQSSFFDQRIGVGDELRHLRKVVYRNDRPSIVLANLQDFSPFFTKSMEWSYETEWRMMLLLSKASRVIGSGASGVHLFEYPRSAINSVTLGCRMTEAKQNEVRQLLANTDQLKHVQCKLAQINAEHYRLNISDI